MGAGYGDGSFQYLGAFGWVFYIFEFGIVGLGQIVFQDRHAALFAKGLGDGIGWLNGAIFRRRDGDDEIKSIDALYGIKQGYDFSYDGLFAFVFQAIEKFTHFAARAVELRVSKGIFTKICAGHSMQIKGQALGPIALQEVSDIGA